MHRSADHSTVFATLPSRLQGLLLAYPSVWIELHSHLPNLMNPVDASCCGFMRAVAASAVHAATSAIGGQQVQCDRARMGMWAVGEGKRPTYSSHPPLIQFTLQMLYLTQAAVQGFGFF